MRPLRVMRLAGLALWLAATLQLATPSARAQAPAAAPSAVPSVAAVSPHTVSHGQFVDVAGLPADGHVQQFVLLLSGNETLSESDRQLARSMVAKGAMVAAVTLPPFYRRIAAESAKCVYAGGAVENFARYVQAFEKMPTYIEPVLVGTGSGGAFAYALLAQSPPDSFTAALSVGYCPRLPLAMPLCPANALRWRAAVGAIDLEPVGKLAAPWTVLPTDGKAACAAEAQAFVGRVPQATWLPRAATEAPADVPPGFDAAYARLAANRAALDTPPAQLSDLPVVEVPAGGAGRRFVVLVSGDGGWADIDKRIAAALAKDGVPTAGIDSLRYFWSARTPEGVAADLDRVIRYYGGALEAQRGHPDRLLAGRRRVALRAQPAAGPDARQRAADRVARAGAEGILRVPRDQLDRQERRPADRARGAEDERGDHLCVYGADEKKDSLCPQLTPAQARTLAMPGGHHLGGDYDALTARILEAVPLDVPHQGRGQLRGARIAFASG